MPGIKTKRGQTASGGRAGPAAVDAIGLLEADHRQVEGWFSQYNKARGDDRKLELATSLCAALKIHARIEEEIFYPAFLEATGERELHHEAEIEHDFAKRLIAAIESSTPADDYYDAKVNVLAEMIRHHVKEEERPGGMFARARRSNMDLLVLGQQLRERKQQYEGAVSALPVPGTGRDGLLGRILEVATR